jgi:hypothetical protein
MKQSKTFFLGVLFLVSIFASFKIYKSEQVLLQDKNDLIELSSVEYGLLNVDTWENLLANIIVSKLDDFKADEMSNQEMKKNVSALLKTLIDDYEKSIQKKNSKELFGSLKNSLYASAFDGIREDIPTLTEKVMAFLDVKNNKDGIKEYIVLLLKEYTNSSFSRTDYSKVNAIVKKHEGATRENTVPILQQKITIQNQTSKSYKIILASSFLGFILILFFIKNFSKIDYLITILFSFLLLFLGITLPMIEIDARISEINFSFLDETISFTNQVLFYKSKSIYEVVTLMMAQRKFDLIAVGTLIFLFSVLFPITKLISSILFLSSQKLKEHKIIQFFIFKTGKWSMADVFVIAIIMAFIGFEGIITDQLNQLESFTESAAILTTNNSSVLFGFFSFTAFVLLSIAISHKLQKSNTALKNI